MVVEAQVEALMGQEDLVVAAAVVLTLGIMVILVGRVVLVVVEVVEQVVGKEP